MIVGARRRRRGARPRRLRRGRARCADFLLDQLRDDDGRLLRTYKDGRATLNAYLEDHAFLTEALLVLYEATFETRWFSEARALADVIDRALRRPAAAASSRPPTTTSSSSRARRTSRTTRSRPATRPRRFALLRLRGFTGEREYEQRRVGRPPAPARAGRTAPSGFGHLLQALHFHFAPRREVALVGERSSRWRGRALRLPARPRDRRDEARRRARRRPRSRCCATAAAVDGRAAAYVCENFTCKLPGDRARGARAQLGSRDRGAGMSSQRSGAPPAPEIDRRARRGAHPPPAERSSQSAPRARARPSSARAR